MRKISAVLLMLILLVSLALPGSAAAADKFLLKEYDFDENTVYCYGKKLPAGGELTVFADSKAVENVTFSTLQQSDIPVTIYCLVDASTSLPKAVKQQQADILMTLSSLMGEKDSMVLGILSDSVVETKPMTEKDAREMAIKTIERKVWYTNLYQGISQVMDTIYTSTAYETNRCLVILGDGHDDGKSNVTAEFALEKVKEYGIPVYSIMMGTPNAEEKKGDLRYQQQLAEESLGGFLCQPHKENITSAIVAERIWESVKGATVISIDKEELQGNRTDQELLIRYDAEEVWFEDTILLRAADLVIPEAETEATGETTIETTTATEPGKEEPKEDFPRVILFAAGIGAVLLVTGIVVFALTRKKKPVVEFDIPVNNEPIATEPPEAGILQMDIPPQEPIVPVSPEGCHVFAVGIMHPEVTADFWLKLKEETTFGRNDKAAVILCGKDKKLSGVHGSFFWDGKILLVRDMNSKNGTMVNGEICHDKVWLRLEDGAVLRAGSYEYRITFQMPEGNQL